MLNAISPPKTHGVHAARSIILLLLFFPAHLATGAGAELPPPEEIAELSEDGGPEYNRLVFEKSPYLLQHARNPVDWYPWGEPAFEKAEKERKLVFLSVGYSTCHWCHVMERESFEDEAVAALLNEHFVSVKVDREERPDIDEIYMTVTQAMTGSGGWPMTVVLTPDRKPVFAGTYFPKESNFGRIGMLELLPKISQAWRAEPEKFRESAERITEFLRQQGTGSAGDVAALSVLDQAFHVLKSTFDAERGGFGRAPKFPTPHQLTYLLRYWKRTENKQALNMVYKTLTAMRLGGIYDHVGFGFHRYSVDPDWFVPHFEKMLYDQALLAIAYTEAWQATDEPLYAQTAREILAYVQRDLTAPEGGFYSAEDADSEGEEGKFYVWTVGEIDEILGEEDGALFRRVYHFETGGNWTEGREHQTNIPHLKAPWRAIAQQEGVPEEELRSRLAAIRERLFEARAQRVHPHKDDKILTDWNGLMIAAFARAGRAMGDETYTAIARHAADFILGTMKSPDGRLHHRYRLGEAGLPAHLEDYAFLVWGLLELYEASFEVAYLQEAVALNEQCYLHYWDEARGGFFMTADDAEKLLVRPKTIYDGAIPSGNSVAALNQLRLARMTGDTRLEQRADALVSAFGGTIEAGPSNVTQLLHALDFAAGPTREVVVAGKPGAEDTMAMLEALQKPFLPNAVVVFRPDTDTPPPIARLATYTEHQRAIDGAATAYVCENFVCGLPTTEISEMIALLAAKKETGE